MDKKQFLVDELDMKIEDFKKGSNTHKDMHRRFRYVAFIFTGVLSILAGLALYLPEYSSTVNILILLISACAGVITSLEGLRKADELWIHERTTYYTLCDLKRELEYNSKSENIKEDIVDDLFLKFQQVLTNAGDKWSSGIVQGRQQDLATEE